MDAIEAITGRHGVLDYESTPVEAHQIEQVLRAAVAAPSPANTQPWAYVVVTERALIDRLAAYLVKTQREQVFGALMQMPESFADHLMRHFNSLSKAPCFIVLCRHRRAPWAGSDHNDLVRDWELCCLGAAMANLMTAATALGLGTRWFGNPAMDPGPLKKLLQIPEEVEVVAVTPLGHHQELGKERPVQELGTHTGFRHGDKHGLAALLQGKLALQDVVHYNSFRHTRGGN